MTNTRKGTAKRTFAAPTGTILEPDGLHDSTEQRRRGRRQHRRVQKHRQRRSRRLGSRRSGDIAVMAAFLASPGARNITGQTINVDGGLVMH